MTSFKSTLRQLGETFGIEIRRNPFADPYKLQRHLTKEEAPVIFDVGAHVGEISIVYRKMFPAARLFAFEPYPPSFATLNETLGSQPLTKTFPEALYGRSGKIQLHVNSAEATNSLLPTDPAAATTWGPGLLDTAYTIDVPCRTLDSVCDEEGLNRIDILKIDVQGAELSVLEGARMLLGRQDIALIYFEVILTASYRGQANLHDYLRFMESFDYRFLDIFNPVRMHGRLLQFDLMFAAPSVPDVL